jgi:GNAT superfamily N-acetyltransferase
MRVALVHVRSWQAAYRGLLPDAFLAGLKPEGRAARYTLGADPNASPETFVAEEAGAVLGFTTLVPREGDVGELGALYADPTAWNRGVGRALIDHARARLAARGHRSAVLWLLEGNARGERFYRADGWAPDGERRSAEVWGLTVTEVRFRRTLS